MNPTRVVVTGSECTGKTTLARELAAHYGTVWVAECARVYLDSVGRALEYADVDGIARGQMTAEAALVPHARAVIFLDTDLVSTIVYSRHYYGDCPAWVVEAARQRLAPLYLLLHPDVPWLPDGLQRDRPNRREEIHGLFRDTLASLGASVMDVRGPWGARSASAIRAVDALLGG